MKSNLSVLYMEDDLTLRKAFSPVLAYFFTTIYEAADGEEALALYTQHKPHIILLDINVPKLNGLEVAETIRKEDVKTPIIMLTAFAEQDMLLKAANLEILGYLVKPVRSEELHATLNKAISRIQNDSALKLIEGFSWQGHTKELFFNETPIRLTKNEQAVVELLCTDQNRYFKACDIAQELFGHSDMDGQCNNVVQLISRMKSKLMKIHRLNDFFIQNLYGSGYKIVLQH